MKRQEHFDRKQGLKGKSQILSFAILFLLSGCGLFEWAGETGGPGKTPGNLEQVSFNDLPGWQDDDLRYALQAFRNSCKAKIQYEGEVIPDKGLFAEKCKFMPSESASVDIVRKWFESNFQPYEVSDNTRGKFTGYY